MLVEQISAGPGGYRSTGNERQLVVHTFWGGRVNRPWGLALRHAWQQRYGTPVELSADNDALIVQLTEDVDPQEFVRLVSRHNLLAHLREALEHSDFFGARFRECAGRALLLTRKKFNARLPLWLTRMQSKKLLAATRTLSDFPILLEAWRTCLEDEFDLQRLELLLDELHDGELEVRYVDSTTPSPFAANLSWNQINRYMYADDTPEEGARSNLDDALIDSAFADRPRVSHAVVADFVARRQRTFPGYAPEDASDWAEWVKERLLMSTTDVPQEHHAMLARVGAADRTWLCHPENVGVLCEAFELQVTHNPVVAPHSHSDPRDAVALAQEILSFEGPLTEPQLGSLLPPAAVHAALAGGFLVHGSLLREDNERYYCDADNFEMLLRFQRRASRPTLEPRAVTDLPGWVAHWQNSGAADYEAALDRLRGFSAPVATWLHELLPPRLAADTAAAPGGLEAACTELDFAWLGTGKERICLDYAEDLAANATPEAEPDKALHSLFRDPAARYGFTQLLDADGRSAEAFNAAVWAQVWRGALTSDSIDSLIAADRAGYQLTGHTSSRRARRLSWPGTWWLTTPAGDTLEPSADPLLQLELAKNSARVLLERYGVICRDLRSVNDRLGVVAVHVEDRASTDQPAVERVTANARKLYSDQYSPAAYAEKIERLLSKIR